MLYNLDRVHKLIAFIYITLIEGRGQSMLQLYFKIQWWSPSKCELHSNWEKSIGYNDERKNSKHDPLLLVSYLLCVSICIRLLVRSCSKYINVEQDAQGGLTGREILMEFF